MAAAKTVGQGAALLGVPTTIALGAEKLVSAYVPVWFPPVAEDDRPLVAAALVAGAFWLGGALWGAIRHWRVGGRGAGANLVSLVLLLGLLVVGCAAQGGPLAIAFGDSTICKGALTQSVDKNGAWSERCTGSSLRGGTLSDAPANLLDTAGKTAGKILPAFLVP